MLASARTSSRRSRDRAAELRRHGDAGPDEALRDYGVPVGRDKVGPAHGVLAADGAVHDLDARVERRVVRRQMQKVVRAFGGPLLSGVRHPDGQQHDPPIVGVREAGGIEGNDLVGGKLEAGSFVRGRAGVGAVRIKAAGAIRVGVRRRQCRR